jgi:hypothetical protein
MKKAIFLALTIMLSCINAIAQTTDAGTAKHTVTGTVRDAATGAVITGANIDVPGIASAITEDDGYYSISLPLTEIIMIATAESYSKQEISVRGRNTIDIALYEKNYKGAAKNVFTPFGDKSSVTGVYSWFGITEDNLASNSATADVLLKTQASGLNVLTRSSMPASGSNFYLRSTP